MFECGIAASGGGNVRGDARDRGAGAAELGDGRRKRSLAPATDDDARALCNERLCERETDSARATGDEDTLALDVHCFTSSILSWVLVSKSAASWRSRSCSDGAPAMRLTIRPRFTAGRARMASAQRCTCL